MTDKIEAKVTQHVVKGSGFNSNGGGFAKISVNGTVYDAQYVASVFLAALAAPASAAEPVKVKPLEWVDDETRPDTSWQANTFWGHYRIFQVWWGAQDKWGFCCADTAEQLFHTLEAAKAAAQADYEQRILSALATPPASSLSELDRLQSSNEASEWQPIETAPKDGTEFLANDGASTVVCWWRERDPEGYLDGFPWRFAEIDDGSVSENGYSVNHPPKLWMPMPVPTSSQTGGK
jgi:hypothetical protein